MPTEEKGPDWVLQLPLLSAAKKSNLCEMSVGFGRPPTV
jgi:hypothetical protein